MTLDQAAIYLARMERNRKKDESYNQRAYDDARNLAAWVSLAKYGNNDIAKIALKQIKSI
jgi:hypothetical protein